MTRSLLLLPAVAAALALGACGGSDDNGGASTGSSQDDKAFEGALKYAKCMREHGVDMPDPKRSANGGISLSLKGGPNQSAKVEAAQKDCQKYMKIGGGKAPSAAEQAKVKDAMLAYARCMRAHGIDMPDPQFSTGPGGGTVFKLGGPGKNGGTASGPNPDSPAFKAADKACHSKLAGIEKGGPGGGPSTQGQAG